MVKRQGLAKKLVRAARSGALRQMIAAAPKQTQTAKAPRRQRVARAGKGAGGMPAAVANGVFTASDGINKSLVTTNDGRLEDRFQVRREKIADISGSTTSFSLSQSLYVNPGNSVLFPIFSQIASVYEMYRVNKLRFYFKTEAYTASGSNQSAGMVVLATNFDPDDAAFASLTQMENYEGSVNGPPYSVCLVHDVIVAGRKRNKRDLALNDYFVYSSANVAAPSTSTSKFYDIGLFQLAVANMVGSGVIGELWVEYSFTMIRPKQQTPLGVNALYAHVVEGAAGTAAAAGSAFLGTTGGLLRPGSTIPVVSTQSTFSLPLAGTFLVSTTWVGSVTVVPSFSPGSNISLVSVLHDNATADTQAVSSGVTCWIGVYSVAASGTAAANLLTISGLTNLSSGTADILISQVSAGITLRYSAPRNLALDDPNFDRRLSGLVRSIVADMKSADERKSGCEQLALNQVPCGAVLRVDTNDTPVMVALPSAAASSACSSSSLNPTVLTRGDGTGYFWKK